MGNCKCNHCKHSRGEMTHEEFKERLLKDLEKNKRDLETDPEEEKKWSEYNIDCINMELDNLKKTFNK